MMMCHGRKHLMTHIKNFEQIVYCDIRKDTEPDICLSILNKNFKNLTILESNFNTICTNHVPLPVLFENYKYVHYGNFFVEIG